MISSACLISRLPTLFAAPPWFHESYNMHELCIRWYQVKCYNAEANVARSFQLYLGCPKAASADRFCLWYCNDVVRHLSSTCLMYVRRWYELWSLLGAFALPVTLRFSSTIWTNYASGACKLNLNPSKCKIITFTLRKKPVVSTYYMNHIALERASEMRDLGVILDSILNFGPHIDSIV